MGVGKIVRKLIGGIGHDGMESYSLPSFQWFPSSRRAGTPGFLRHPPVDSFEQIAELGRRNYQRAIGRRRPDKPSAF
jgi:hypothetical protein